AFDAMSKADFLVDAVLGRGLAHIVEDARSVGDRLRVGPRLERITQREHVAVGTDAGIAKQIPGAANRLASFEDDKTLGRALRLQMIARADPGQAGADDQHVEVLGCHRGLLRRLLLPPCPLQPVNPAETGNATTEKAPDLLR